MNIRFETAIPLMLLKKTGVVALFPVLSAQFSSTRRDCRDSPSGAKRAIRQLRRSEPKAVCGRLQRLEDGAPVGVQVQRGALSRCSRLIVRRVHESASCLRSQKAIFASTDCPPNVAHAAVPCIWLTSNGILCRV